MSTEPLDLATIIQDHESKHFCPRPMRRAVWDPIVLGECLPYQIATLAQEQADRLMSVRAVAEELVLSIGNDELVEQHADHIVDLAGEQS